jgi:hypothetical protein
MAAADKSSPLADLQSLRPGMSVTIVGKVLRSSSESTTITDGRLEITVSNLRPGISGIVEVEGSVISPVFVEAKRFCEFQDEEFDFDTHYNLIDMYKRYSIFT